MVEYRLECGLTNAVLGYGKRVSAEGWNIFDMKEEKNGARKLVGRKFSIFLPVSFHVSENIS